VLCLLGKTDRTRELTATVMLSSFICIAIAGIVPSAGALAYYHPSSAFYMQNHPVVDIAYKQVFFDLRAGLMTHLSLVDAHGLVAFPSYHVGMSLIVILAFRGMKGWIFWPLVALNILVILSTPIDGGHHLSDGLGGLVLVLVSWGAINWLRKRLPKPANAAGEENYGELAGQKA
jgi:membrane-associated phospholipid phosphatase